jgi:hypothetical protein
MARLFNDANPDTIEVDTTTPVLAVPLTMAGWGYPDASGLVMFICGVGNSAGNSNTRIGVHSTNVGFANRQDIGVANAFALGATTIALNTWQHIAATFVGTTPCTVTLYYNGAVDVTGTATNLGTVNATRTSIGITPGNLGAGLRPWSGSLAEIGMWDVALTAAEIAALGKGYTPKLIRPTALRLYVPIVRDVVDVRGGLALTTTGTSVSVHPRVIYAG